MKIEISTCVRGGCNRSATANYMEWSGDLDKSIPNNFCPDLDILNGLSI